MLLSRRSVVLTAALRGVVCGADGVDLSSVAPDMELPPVSDGKPAAGKRVRQRLPEYAGSNLWHLLYLPADWKPGRRFPVIVEYAGNGGDPDSSKLGFGLTAGRGCLWLCLPYVNQAHNANEKRWWGDLDATIRYLHEAVRLVCREFGGDASRLILAGFSRGAIACGYIGLHDDDTAALWRGFFAYSHFDGVLTRWPYPGADRAAALRRLARLKGRPVFVAQEQGPDADHRLPATRAYIESAGAGASFTYQELPSTNHDNAWVLRDTPAREAARRWLTQVLSGSREGIRR